VAEEIKLDAKKALESLILVNSVSRESRSYLLSIEKSAYWMHTLRIGMGFLDALLAN
jgi:hypothetical protein